MAVLLFLLWILLNGRFTFDAGMLQIVISGVIVSGLVYIFAVKAFSMSPKAELYFWKNVFLLIAYAAVLVFEVIKANFAVISIILNKKKNPSPAIVKIRVPLKRGFSRFLLANSITLTPGTITVEQEEDIFIVHCLDRSLAEGIEKSVFVKLLERMEKKK
ncbi:MAG: Na+/H+ antiporter subunit E [Eubacteriales bacterium]